MKRPKGFLVYLSARDREKLRAITKALSAPSESEALRIAIREHHARLQRTQHAVS